MSNRLFYDEDATYGKSWGIKEYLDKHLYTNNYGCFNHMIRSLDFMNNYKININIIATIQIIPNIITPMGIYKPITTTPLSFINQIISS